MRPLFTILVTIMVLAPIHARAVTTIALINENFSTGAGVVTGTTWSHNGLNWVWSNVTGSVAPNGTEVYDSSGSTARGMPTTHGGFEVFSQTSGSEPVAGSIWQVAVTVVLPIDHPAIWNGNTLSFDMGYRSAVSSSSFQLYNVTDARSIVSQSITGSLGSWKNYSFNPIFSNADAGDTLQLIWKDAAAGSIPRASGLEVGAVVFNAVPEPSALSLMTVGLGALAAIRWRRS